MLFLMGMGLVQKRLNTDSSDYFRGGCRGTWWLVGTSAFMSGISAYTFTAAAGVAFEAGFSSLVVYMGNTLGFIVCAIFIAHKFRQLRATTTADVIEMRFGNTTRKFYAWISVLKYTVMAGLPLYALALFLSAVFGFNIYFIIIIVGGIVLFYSTAGGKWAVMSNDFLQSIVLFAITLLLAILSLYKCGGVSGFFELIRENQLSYDYKIIANAGDFAGNKFTWVWAAAMIINTIIFQNTIFVAPRYFSVKDGSGARKAAILSAILMFFGSLFWFIPSMAARFFYEDQVSAVNITAPAEASYAIIAMNILPNGMLGLVLVAMFAATMSNLDTGFNANSAIIVRNIYPDVAKLFNLKELSEKGKLLLGQISTIIIGLLVIAIALLFASNKDMGIFDILLTLTALIGIPLSIPMLMCLFVKKVPAWSALFTVAITFIVSTIGFYSEFIFGDAWTFQKKYLLALIIGCISFVLTKLFWKYSDAAYRQKVDDFYKLMNKPVDFDKEVGGSLDTDQFRTLGIFIAALGVFISALLFVPNQLWGRLCIGVVAGFIVAIGLIMYKLGKKKRV